MILNNGFTADQYPHIGKLQSNFTKESKEYQYDSSGNMLLDENGDPDYKIKKETVSEEYTFHFRYLNDSDTTRYTLFDSSQTTETSIDIELLDTFPSEVLNNKSRIYIDGKRWKFMMTTTATPYKKNSMLGSAADSFYTQFHLTSD